MKKIFIHLLFAMTLISCVPKVADQKKITTTIAAVTNISSSKSNGTYKAGDNIDITVTFSDIVKVTGSPQLLLETGDIQEVAIYLSGSGTKILTFRYTVVDGDLTTHLDYSGSDAIDLNEGTITTSQKANALLTLPDPGQTNSLGFNKYIAIDTTIPIISNVTSSKSNRTYTVSSSIDITVNFTKVVYVSGMPRLLLETGTFDRYATYLSGSGTTSLTFSYTVLAGDMSADLEYNSSSALELNAGTIKDIAGNNATLTLAIPGAINSLSYGKAIVIDTTVPTVVSINSATANGTYKSGSAIGVTITFSEAVNVSGSPKLLLETGTTSQYATYVSGSGTNALTFTYTVQVGDSSSDLDYKTTTALILNGGTIADADYNSAILTLPAPGTANSLGANKAIVIDAISPTITSVSSSNTNGTFNPGALLTITATFSEIVIVDISSGTPQLALNMGSNTRQANYATGSGTNTLSFTYTTQAGDTSSDLDYTGTNALTLNLGTIKDSAGNNATLTLASPGATNSLSANKALVIVDNTAPIITSVSSSKANGTYSASTSIDVTITFSKAVTVTGMPRLLLETGATDRYATYASGTGTYSLTFNYTVLAGDSTNDLDYNSINALELNAGTIKDSTAISATLTLPVPGAANSLGANKAIVIDTTAPTITNITSTTANGTYKAGSSIVVTVTFSEAVTVAGYPRLLLETGATDRYANYASGSGTTTLTFNYTVQSGDTSADLDYVDTTSLSLNSGSIFDAGSNGAILTLPAPGAASSLGSNKAIVIDTTSPTVTNVSSTNANSTFGAGTLLTVTVTFSEVVVVDTSFGIPQIALALGSTRQAVYTSGTGTNTLSFTYTTQAGDNASDLDYTATTALILNSGTIKDSVGNAATLTLASPAAATSLGANKNIVIDTTGPTVTSVTSTNANATYIAGTILTITATFSENVTVTGLPQIALALGSTRQAVYASGTGTNILSFTYTTVATDTTSDLDYTSTSALTLNSGTIKDSVGNDATLTLPAPAATNSLGANKAIVIDTTGPAVTSVSSSTANGSYGLGALLTITVTFDDTVVVTGTPQIALSLGSTRQANYSTGTGTNTMSFTYTVAASDIAANLDYNGTTALALNSGTIKDSVGNNATLTLASPGATNSLGNNKAILVDTVAPILPGGFSITETAPYATYRNSTTLTPAFSWSGYTLGAGESYDYCINSSACVDPQTTCNIVNWTSNGTATSKTAITVSGLTDKSDYFSCVRARDAVGNISLVKSSDGWIVDVTAPVFSGPITLGADPTDLTTSATITFPTATDTNGSGLGGYKYCLRLSSAAIGTGCTWTTMSTISGAAITGLWLSPASTYMIDMYAFDNIGNTSAILTSTGQTFLTPHPIWQQEAYIKSLNSDSNDEFGHAVSVSADTIAVGVPFEDSDQSTITNAATASAASGNDNNPESGATYVYKRTGTTWAQQAYIKASNNDTNDNFGYSINIATDTLVVGAPRESSNQTSITNGTTSSANNSNSDSGAIYVYTRSGTTWTQEAYIKASNSEEADQFGYNVSISADTIAVGVYLEDSDQTTITNSSITAASSDNSNSSSGAVYIYKRTGTTWAQEAYIKSFNNDASDFFGQSVSISGDTIVVGAPGESGSGTTITNSTSLVTTNNNPSSGAVYVYKRTGTTWAQEAYIKASNNDANDSFGMSVSLDTDTIAVGVSLEASNVSSITNGATTASSDNSNVNSGAVYIYKRTGTTWAQEAYIKAVNSDENDYFGTSVSIQGNLLAVGAPGESSNQKIITNGTTASNDNTNIASGAVYVYRRVGSIWAQEAYIKANNNETGDSGDNFGNSVSVSDDTIVVGASGEDSSQAVITNSATASALSANNSSLNSGAVYVFRFK